MYLAIGVEPTKLTAAIPGWVQDRVDRLLVAVHDLEHAVGTPASLSSSARIRAAEGTLSETLRMKQLPQARATGNIHIGTMTGKLNGVIPATTPSGWRSEWLSTRVPTFSVTSPLSSCGAAVANSTTSVPRAISPSASDQTLPCSATMTSAIRFLMLLEQAQEAVEDPRSPQWGCHRPFRQRRLRERDRLVDLGRTGQRHHSLLLAGRRVEHRRGAAALAGNELAADEMLDLGRHDATSDEGFVQASFRPTLSAVALMVA